MHSSLISPWNVHLNKNVSRLLQQMSGRVSVMRCEKNKINEIGHICLLVETNDQSQLLIKAKMTQKLFYFPLHFCADYIWWINYQTISSVKCKRVTQCWLSGDRRQSGQIWEGKAISCFFAVRPLGFYLSFNVRISSMKVKVVCACSVSLGCWFFYQRGEKVDFLL